ncbi:uncharacterized protein LOC125675033 isoform X2 [Ostrea edulis]|uniref:uncharacterized protein LOC125675033 isoform X2 n=1 Tax=Ostrea edulis TaxID=37623 RepID=UPI0024AEA7C1|nr:uncharacterized protein LOC125675033 isoform X2 [Ostrea edulis]
MAESPTSIDSRGDEELDPVRTRCRIYTDNHSTTDLGVDRPGAPAQPRIKQKRKSSDPLPDLTKDQRVVLYTLLLCENAFGGVRMDDDVIMGDIDVRRTLSELAERQLVLYFDDNVPFCVHLCQREEIMRSCIENCLLSDIDKDFYLQVASGGSLHTYAVVYLSQSTYTEQPYHIPITLMRLVIEGRAKDAVGYHQGFEQGLADEGFQKFTQGWCRMKNLDPMAWADGIPRKEVARFLSAHTFLKGLHKGFTELVLDQKRWSILISILMSEKYTISVNALYEDKLKKIQGAFPSLGESNHSISTTEAVKLIKDLVHNHKLLTMNEDDSSGTVEFISDDVRHQVMIYFVLDCLKTDEDYANCLNMSSLDSLLEYVRPRLYKPCHKERCVYLPKRMTEVFIRRLGIDAIRHAMVEEREIYKRRMSDDDDDDDDYDDDGYYYYDNEIWRSMRQKVSEILKVPLEILEWDFAARSRYAECVKKGTQTIHRARAMIVGCAGAGKSTLLERLQKRSLDELKKVQSTIGLEVHEDIFEIAPEFDFLKDLPVDTDKEMKQLLSVVDFGGQCAYYACHQVYLSRRAFYLLVIDMSKAFDEKVDPALCEQAGTMFTDWSYGEYLLFWLKSVHTYCDNDTPVIIVGTHLDETSAQNCDTFYNSILESLKFDKHLKSHLDRKRCFVVGFKSDGSSFQDTLSELEKCIVSIAKQDKWREVIPIDWALSEVVLRELRRQGVRMTSVTKLLNKCFGKNEDKYTQMSDILRFYHDIGVVLHLDGMSLAETVIVDIQWFVDSFKNIITDSNHVRDIVDNDRDWSSFYKSGHILDRLLTDIWESRRFEINYWEMNENKATLLQYMQRLGLISVGTEAHYIPCMNKMTFGEKEERFFQSIQSKTSVLVFRFHFLPYFFYFRLVVACLTKTNGEWTVLEDNGLCLYKNVACFRYKGHVLALAVNKYSIQLQVFQPGNFPFAKVVTLEIRDNVEKLLNGLTSNFHKNIMYTVGYQCSKQEVFREHDDCFVEEIEIHRKGNTSCPKHGMINYHILSESALLFYWKQDVLTEVTNLEWTSLSVPEPRKYFKTFDELTKIGRDALQIYFDKIFPPMDLAIALTNNEHSLQHGHHKLDADQCDMLFPADRSIPSSAAFDVTVMYKLLRNYGPSISPPSKGWGKRPDIGQKLPTDDMERIRLYRNEVQHKTRTTSLMEKDDFELKWKDLSQAILRLSNGSLKKDIMALTQQQ